MILITRLKEQSKELELSLISQGHKTIQENLFNIKYYKNKVFYNRNNYYIFPSIHSVKSLVKNKQIHKFKDANIFAIGKKVKQELINYGCKKIIATTVDSTSLITILATKKFLKAKFIYLCSDIVNNDFFVKTKKHKISIEKKTIYKTLPVKKFTNKLLNNFRLNKIKSVTLYSKLATETFLNLLAKYKMLSQVKKIQYFCISERVATPLRQKNFSHVYVAAKPNQECLIAIFKKNILEFLHVIGEQNSPG